MTNSLLAYRTSAGEGATHIGLLLLVYDALAEDMRFAGEAAANGDIAARCRHSKHALLLLGHLESWVPFLEDDAVLQQSLTCFYIYLRGEIIRLQSATQGEGFAELAMRVCETRAVWQRKQGQLSSPIQMPLHEIRPSEMAEEKSDTRLSWSA